MPDSRRRLRDRGLQPLADREPEPLASNTDIVFSRAPEQPAHALPDFAKPLDEFPAERDQAFDRELGADVE